MANRLGDFWKRSTTSRRFCQDKLPSPDRTKSTALVSTLLINSRSLVSRPCQKAATVWRLLLYEPLQHERAGIGNMHENVAVWRQDGWLAGQGWWGASFPFCVGEFRRLPEHGYGYNPNTRGIFHPSLSQTLCTLLHIFGLDRTYTSYVEST